jgi:hypothetical protein
VHEDAGKQGKENKNNFYRKTNCYKQNSNVSFAEESQQKIILENTSTKNIAAVE